MVSVTEILSMIYTHKRSAIPQKIQTNAIIAENGIFPQNLHTVG